MVPGGIAEFLGLPQLTFAREITIEGQKAVIKRVTQTGYQTVESQLPAVITIASGSFEAIYPTMKGIMGGKKKPFTHLSPPDLGIAASQVGAARALSGVPALATNQPLAPAPVAKHPTH